jgi:hypothetical protein
MTAPIRPGKIVAVGKNYLDHVREMGGDAPAEEPILFMKPPSAVIGDGEAILLPPQSQRVDYEGELVAVVGERLRNVDAATALGWGLVNRVVPESQLEETALEIAAELAANAPLSVRGNKRIMRELLHAEGELDPTVERELIALREASFRSEDMQEGVRAFGEKRPPRWQGR